MENFALRPKSDYMNTAGFESLAVLTERWQSNLDFYKDEIRFLHSLISKYFIWLTHEDNVSKVQQLAAKVSEVDKERGRLSQTVAKHMGHLTLLMENAYTHDEQTFREEHAKLEDELSAFVKAFRSIKQEVFQVTERVIESEKLNRLIAAE
ncbi:MAG: hypothetical protein H6585_08085 [Flavobacteriales bacterium]|nr:hypothetical protein [Flavobacteriales bacterium]MCB9448287.1 hypothetical protein [Flavobacteriales bacterium]